MPLHESCGVGIVESRALTQLTMLEPLCQLVARSGYGYLGSVSLQDFGSLLLEAEQDRCSIQDLDMVRTMLSTQFDARVIRHRWLGSRRNIDDDTYPCYQRGLRCSLI